MNTEMFLFLVAFAIQIHTSKSNFQRRYLSLGQEHQIQQLGQILQQTNANNAHTNANAKHESVLVSLPLLQKLLQLKSLLSSSSSSSSSHHHDHNHSPSSVLTLPVSFFDDLGSRRSFSSHNPNTAQLIKNRPLSLTEDVLQQLHKKVNQHHPLLTHAHQHQGQYTTVHHQGSGSSGTKPKSRIIQSKISKSNKTKAYVGPLRISIRLWRKHKYIPKSKQRAPRTYKDKRYA